MARAAAQQRATGRSPSACRRARQVLDTQRDVCVVIRVRAAEHHEEPAVPSCAWSILLETADQTS
jgi:hypothetical protein